MDDFVEVALPADTLDALGLPLRSYPVPSSAAESVLCESGRVNLVLLLSGLQQWSTAHPDKWLDAELALDRLSVLLTPADVSDVLVSEGTKWWLEVGPVDLCHEIVTLQRADRLLAAISRRADGRLRVASYRPLDRGSAEALIHLGMRPHPDYGCEMRENNWEYALDASAFGMGKALSAEAGHSYLSYWRRGLGSVDDGTEIEEFVAQWTLKPRSPGLLVAELQALAQAEST